MTEQNADTFWITFAAIYAKKPKCFRLRTHNSLCSRWTTVVRTAQKYLAADIPYRSAIPSGEIEEDTLTNVMTLYRNNTSLSTKKSCVLQAPFVFCLLYVYLLHVQSSLHQFWVLQMLL